jgi:hypothetical protein
MMRGATNNKMRNDLLLTAATIVQAREMIAARSSETPSRRKFQEGHARMLMRLRLSVMNESGSV